MPRAVNQHVMIYLLCNIKVAPFFFSVYHEGLDDWQYEERDLPWWQHGASNSPHQPGHLLENWFIFAKHTNLSPFGDSGVWGISSASWGLHNMEVMVYQYDRFFGYGYWMTSIPTITHILIFCCILFGVLWYLNWLPWQPTGKFRVPQKYKNVGYG